jgi:hypothetical protein
VADVADWTRFDDHSPDGMTLGCLRVDRADALALRFALALGRLPAPLGWAYAQRDVRLTRASGAMAVLVAPDRRPWTLFELGRRLVGAWIEINALGYAWHPMSVVIDRPETVDTLRGRLGGRDRWPSIASAGATATRRARGGGPLERVLAAPSEPVTQPGAGAGRSAGMM